MSDFKHDDYLTVHITEYWNLGWIPVYKILWIELVMASHLGIGMHSNTTAHGI